MAKKKSNQQAKAGVGRNTWVLVGAGVVLAVVAVAAVFSLTRGGGSSSTPSALKPTPVTFDTLQAAVDVVDNKFKPATIRVKNGTTVTWSFKGKVPHTVTALPGTGVEFDSGAKPNGTFDFTFDKAGTFDYYCIIHHVMTGTVYVTE